MPFPTSINDNFQIRLWAHFVLCHTHLKNATLQRKGTKALILVDLSVYPFSNIQLSIPKNCIDSQKNRKRS